MNPNVSAQQVKPLSSLSKHGAMPISPKFDGPPPIKPPVTNGVKQPNKNIVLPKPGFF